MSELVASRQVPRVLAKVREIRNGFRDRRTALGRNNISQRRIANQGKRYTYTAYKLHLNPIVNELLAIAYADRSLSERSGSMKQSGKAMRRSATGQPDRPRGGQNEQEFLPCQ